jgi:hypothetical protein
MSPYRLGGTMAVRYIVRPRNPGEVSRMASPDFLSERLAMRLAPLILDFFVQVRDNPTPDDVENANRIWNGANDKEVHLATIEIRGQHSNSPASRWRGEALSFSPWNCLAEHRPLGGLNRVRLAVYRASKDVRHRLNGIGQT